MHEVLLASGAAKDLDSVHEPDLSRLRTVTILRVLRRSERTYKNI